MKIIKKTILLFIILISLSSCKGQNNKTTNNNSLGKLVENIDDKIWAIHQDKKENYWFGSNGNGVFHYDGKQLKLITTKDGLISNTIRAIKEDHLGNIFIGTPKGVSKFDGNTFTSLKPITSNNWKSEPNDLWFNCNGNHIYRYDGKNLYELQLPKQDLKKAFGIEVKGVPFKNMNNSPYAVYGIDKDKKGNIWFGTVTAGAFRYDGKSFLWFGEKELTALPNGGVPGVRSILEDKEGNIWLSNFISKYKISDNNGIAKYEKLKGIDKSNEHFQGRPYFFNSGLSDDNGNLWMTTYSNDVWKYDGNKLLNFKVHNDEIEVLLITIYKDNKGVIWVGTDNAGAYKFDGKTFEKFEPMNN
jgi:ligand-binding sensor domain-containing protein